MMEHDDEQEDGGASAFDRKARTRARAKAQAAPPMAVPNGCPACARTGRREVAEHDREGASCDLHQTFCGCPLGVHLQGQRGGDFFYAVRDAIQARFKVAIVDPTPAQCRPGGAVRRDIPRLGEYVPRAAFQALPHPPEAYAPEIARRGYRFATPPLTLAEARAKLGWNEDGPPRASVPDPAQPLRTAAPAPAARESAASSWSRAPTRPPSSFERATVDAARPLDLGAPRPDDPREIAPGGVPDDHPPWLNDDAQPPWLR